ncbi:MAG: hypothetical protein Q8R47_00555 [Nanoarchaeota archaeon]|nr:hypothetical protein [Nanoarchaeota archaeon]
MFDILEQVVKTEGRNRDYSFLYQKTQNSEQNFVPFVYTKGLNFLRKFMSFGIDAVLHYLPGQDAQQKVDPVKETEESVLEAELEESIEAEGKDCVDLALLRYHRLPEDLMHDFAYLAANEQSYSFAASSDEEEYQLPKPVNDNYETGPSPDEEAREKLQESKYEFLESATDINYEEQQKLAWWIQFNPALFTFLESFYNLNRDVDYRVAA